MPVVFKVGLGLKEILAKIQVWAWVSRRGLMSPRLKKVIALIGRDLHALVLRIHTNLLKLTAPRPFLVLINERYILAGGLPVRLRRDLYKVMLRRVNLGLIPRQY
jgi:hypothetical protein